MNLCMQCCKGFAVALLWDYRAEIHVYDLEGKEEKSNVFDEKYLHNAAAMHFPEPDSSVSYPFSPPPLDMS